MNINYYTELLYKYNLLNSHSKLFGYFYFFSSNILNTKLTLKESPYVALCLRDSIFLCMSAVYFCLVYPPAVLTLLASFSALE